MICRYNLKNGILVVVVEEVAAGPLASHCLQGFHHLLPVFRSKIPALKDAEDGGRPRLHADALEVLAEAGKLVPEGVTFAEPDHGRQAKAPLDRGSRGRRRR